LGRGREDLSIPEIKGGVQKKKMPPGWPHEKKIRMTDVNREKGKGNTVELLHVKKKKKTGRPASTARKTELKEGSLLETRKKNGPSPLAGGKDRGKEELPAE